MKLSIGIRFSSSLVLVAIAVAHSSPTPTHAQSAESPKPKAETGRPAFIKPLSQEQQDTLLKERLNGGMGNSFRRFSNMFLAMSRINLGLGVGPMTPSREIGDVELKPMFPEFYKPANRSGAAAAYDNAAMSRSGVACRSGCPGD